MLYTKNKAIELRKSGLSYRSISKELAIPLSTLSLWFSKEKWSKDIGRTLSLRNAESGSRRLTQFKKARSIALQFSYARAKEEAAKEYKKFKKDKLFLAGLILYWFGGDHASPYYCRISSADPKKTLLFRRFFEETLSVPKEDIRYSLHISSGQNEKIVKKMWIEHLLGYIEALNLIDEPHVIRNSNDGVKINYPKRNK